MKNVLIRYGLISGAIAAGSMLLSTLAMKAYGFDKLSFDYSAYFGFTFIILAMSVIFFGIKAYRDNENDGKVSFGKGLILGLGIAVISCICYSLMWLVIYYNFMPDFMEEYARYSLNKVQESGASAAEIAKVETQIAQAKEMYKTPIGVFAMTFIEPLFIGIFIALVSAFILKKGS